MSEQKFISRSPHLKSFSPQFKSRSPQFRQSRSPQFLSPEPRSSYHEAEDENLTPELRSTGHPKAQRPIEECDIPSTPDLLGYRPTVEHLKAMNPVEAALQSMLPSTPDLVGWTQVTPLSFRSISESDLSVTTDQNQRDRTIDFKPEGLLQLMTHSVSQLDLSRHCVNDEGVVHLMEALNNNDTVTKLSLGHIGNEGMRHIAEALKTNTCITQLHLNNNNIGVKGAALLKEVIKANRTIVLLSLTHNCIGDEGARHIASALNSNSTITEIHLSDNGIGVMGARHLAKAQSARHTAITIELGLDWNGVRQLIHEELHSDTKYTSVPCALFSWADSHEQQIWVIGSITVVTMLTGLAAYWKRSK